jgi:hypothetical protein
MERCQPPARFAAPASSRIIVMRRFSFVFLGIALMAVSPMAKKVYAQSQSEKDDDARRQAEDEEDKKKKKKDKEWNTDPAPLPSVKNAGPCPFVKVLYDAARYVELKDNKETLSAVGWTGEIEGIKSTCEYKGREPIKLQTAIKFSLGRGPQAQGASKDYRYWVAVTLRNQSVINKQYFDIVGEFKPGQDRIVVVDTLKGITIPRADSTVTGSQFEVLVGFDVTPEMAEFNRLGKRFRAVSTETARAGGE